MDSRWSPPKSPGLPGVHLEYVEQGKVLKTEVTHAQKAHKGKIRSCPKHLEEEFEILDNPNGSEGCTFMIAPVEMVKLNEALKPHPSCKACMPLMQSISVGDDPHLMPFSDDPEFNIYVIQ